MNIYDLTLQNNRENGSKLALSIATEHDGTRSYTYSQMFAEVDRLTVELAKLALQPGARVALAAENSPEWTIAFLAILKSRCTAVLLDATLMPADLFGQIDRSDVRCLFASPRVMAKLENLLPAELTALNIFKSGASFRDMSAEWITQPTADADESIAAIIYSSGTTRTAAGIMHSHEALIGATLMCAKANNLKAEDKYLAVVPNSHIYGLICSVLGPMLLTSDVFFIEQNTPAAIKAAFAEYKPTIFPCVPRVFELFKTEADKKIASDPKTKKLFDLFFPICLSLRQKTGINLGKVLFKSIHEAFGGKIEIFCSAGAPMDSKTAEFYIGTGFNMLITYGATETNIPTLGNFGRNLTTDSCGQPYSDIDVKISEAGELLIKSPYMMKGYFRDPELTAQAFEDGWFKTGDLCQLNAKGNYEIVGRSKENIVLASGKKVIPEDVEKDYAGIGGLKDMVVCGVPADGKGYDEIHAFVVTLDPLAEQEAITRDIHQKATGLPPNHKIGQVHFVDEIPRTSLQKPKRFLLKKLAVEESRQMTAATAEKAVPIQVSLEQEVIGLIAAAGQFDRGIVSLDSKPFSGLGIDSLGSIELGLLLENRFGCRVEDSFTPNMTVAELVELVRTADASQKAAFDLSGYPRRKKLSDYRLYRYVCNLARLLYTVRVSNDKVIPEDSGYIVCANHVTNLDYLWLTINFNRRRFEKFCCMAKQEILNNTHVSKLLTQVVGIIPVDRGHVHAETMQCCKRQLTEKWGLLIHPEGTRSENGELGVFKKGAAVLAIESGVPIIPAYIHGAYDLYPKGSKLPRLFNFRRMRKYAVDVAYGTPILPHGQSADELIQQVKDAVLALKNGFGNRMNVSGC